MKQLLAKKLVRSIQAHACEMFPDECCGVVKGGIYVPMQNMAEDPSSRFEVDPIALADLWPVEAIVHSHPNYKACPSTDDMRSQMDMALPWIICPVQDGVAGEVFAFGDQVTRAPLMDRGFRHGVTDCYALIRDWFFFERGIDLPNFARGWDWWVPNEAGETEDLYSLGFEVAGFRRLAEGEKPAVGDVFLSRLGKTMVTNHGGIYLGNGLVLHHPSGRGGRAYDPTQLPKRDAVSRWQSHISHWLRYEGDTECVK